MRLTFSDLSLAILQRIVQLQEQGVVPAYWEQMQAPVTPQEEAQLALITAHLLNYRLNLTIGDSWTFVRGIVTGFEADRPTLAVLYSREYAERLEAATILTILQHIVRRFVPADIRDQALA